MTDKEKVLQKHPNAIVLYVNSTAFKGQRCIIATDIQQGGSLSNSTVLSHKFHKSEAAAWKYAKVDKPISYEDIRSNV